MNQDAQTVVEALEIAGEFMSEPVGWFVKKHPEFKGEIGHATEAVTSLVRDALAAARRLLDAPPGVGERMREALQRSYEYLNVCHMLTPAAKAEMRNFVFGKVRAALAAPAPAEPERAKAGEWISVKERLPGVPPTIPGEDPHFRSNVVIVLVPDWREKIRFGWYVPYVGEWRIEGCNSLAIVTHWQPLPDPPAPAASSAAPTEPAIEP